MLLPVFAACGLFSKRESRSPGWREVVITVKTAHRWVKCHRTHSLEELVCKDRSDKAKRRLSTQLQHAIEALALRQPALSVQPFIVKRRISRNNRGSTSARIC